MNVSFFILNRILSKITFTHIPPFVLLFTEEHNWYIGITDEELEGEWKWFDTGDVAEYTGR